MEYWYQRRALAAGRDVAAAKVADDRDSGQFGERIRIADLPREGRGQIDAVAQGLSVAADRLDIAAGNAGGAQQRERGDSERAAEIDVELADRVERRLAGRVQYLGKAVA